MNGTLTKTGRGGGSAGDDVREVLDSIRQIVRLLRLASREAERDVGLTGAQLFVLQTLSEAKMLSVNDLADRTHTHQSSVSVVAQALVDKGLIARARAADDARRLELTLTPAAKTLLRKAPDAAQGRLIEALERVPSATRKQLAKGLGRLVQETGVAEEEAPMIFEDMPGRAGRGRARGRTARRTAFQGRR